MFETWEVGRALYPFAMLGTPTTIEAGTGALAGAGRRRALEVDFPSRSGSRRTVIQAAGPVRSRPPTPVRFWSFYARLVGSLGPSDRILVYANWSAIGISRFMEPRKKQRRPRCGGRLPYRIGSLARARAHRHSAPWTSPPQSNDERLRDIAAASEGYTTSPRARGYRKRRTAQEGSVGVDRAPEGAGARKRCRIPDRDAEHVKSALAMGRGSISGSRWSGCAEAGM